MSKKKKPKSNNRAAERKKERSKKKHQINNEKECSSSRGGRKNVIFICYCIFDMDNILRIKIHPIRYFGRFSHRFRNNFIGLLLSVVFICSVVDFLLNLPENWAVIYAGCYYMRYSNAQWTGTEFCHTQKKMLPLGNWFDIDEQDTEREKLKKKTQHNRNREIYQIDEPTIIYFLCSANRLTKLSGLANGCHKIFAA